MPKKGRLLPAANRNRTTTAKPPFNPVKWPGKVLTAILGLITFAGVVSYFPIISVDVGPQIDAKSPLSTPFIVSNDGIIPLFSVDVHCRFDDILFDDGSTLNHSEAKRSKSKPVLAPHEKTTGPCHVAFGMILGRTIKRATMTIEVNHNLFVWGPTLTASRSFIGTTTSDGKAVWLPR